MYSIELIVERSGTLHDWLQTAPPAVLVVPPLLSQIVRALRPSFLDPTRRIDSVPELHGPRWETHLLLLLVIFQYVLNFFGEVLEAEPL